MEDNKKSPGSFTVTPEVDHALIEVIGVGEGVQFKMYSVQHIESVIAALEKSKDNIIENTPVLKFGTQLSKAAWLNWKRSNKWKWKQECYNMKQVYLIGNKETATYLRRNKTSWIRSLHSQKAMKFLTKSQAQAHCNIINRNDLFPEAMEVLQINCKLL